MSVKFSDSSKRLKRMQAIVSRKQFSKIEGTCIDLQTANLFIYCYGKASQAVKAKLLTLPLYLVLETIWSAVSFRKA